MTDAFWLVSSASTDSWVRSLCWQIVGSVLYVPGDMGDQEITFADADWSEDSHMEECDPGAPLTEQASSHMRTLLISSKCKSFLMIRRTVGNSTLERISALGIPMFTFELPLQCHMKLY